MSLAPFADLRVLDFSQVLAGPYTGRVLAELGADVIKVEAPGGDLTRVIAPKRDRGQSGLYTWANLGKRGVCIDLAKPEGRALALELIDGADVFLSNVRLAALERLGLGHQALLARNPRLIYAALTGYGLEGPDRDRAAYDIAAFWARSRLSRACDRARR